MDKVLAETGYLNQIENNIEQCLGVNSFNQKARKDIIEKSISKIDTEIELVFKLANNMKSGSASSDLIQNKLEKLAEKKKRNGKGTCTSHPMRNNLSISSSAKAVIKSNILALKTAMKKGKPHFKKRLFGNLFNQLLVTENGSGDLKWRSRQESNL